jgi:spore coat polysaccharide biosynthesis protein SpsF (cytidylyltransferase family)
MTIPILITARLGSERLPNKLLLDLGGIPVIEHMVKRCEHFGFQPYICCNYENDVATFEGVSSCLNIFGKDAAVETALLECALNYDLRLFHQIDGDDPFFDRDMVVESMQCFRRGPISRVLPSIYSQAGTGLVGTSYHLDAKENRIEVLPDPPNMIWPQRLTLDYPEDYHLILAVNRMVGGYMAPRWAVDNLFARNPDLHKINWFRNSEWKARQDSERYRRPVRE